MRIFGLTGGIASGKSTVGRMLRELGAPIVDADLLAREVVGKGSEGLAALHRHFGDSILLPNGELDRKRLGAVVFSDSEARIALNDITHPRIAEAGREAIERLAQAGHEIAIYEAALIVENRLQEKMNGLIVVAIPEALQLQRLAERDRSSEEEARSRVASQLPLSEKIAVADYVIDNSATTAETRQQVEALWARLCAESTTP